MLARFNEANLSADEASDLESHEIEIERDFKAFIRVGTALMDIRDRRLYRERYQTFEAYCAERWSLKRQRAYELMSAAGAAMAVSEISDIQRESHAAELVGLSEEAQRDVWAAAVETAPNGKITASHVRAVAQISAAMQAAPDPVREVVERYGVADADTISELTRLHKQKAETFAEVAASGWIQPGDEEAAVRIDAGALKVREALRDKAQTHRLLAADERRESTRCPNCGFSF